MKKKFCLLLIFSALFLGISSSLSAQSFATINQAGEISLDLELPLQDRYLIDISPLGFADPTQAKDFLYPMNNPGLTIRFVENNLVEIFLNLSHPSTLTWGINEWNAYLQNKIHRI